VPFVLTDVHTSRTSFTFVDRSRTFVNEVWEAVISLISWNAGIGVSYGGGSMYFSVPCLPLCISLRNRLVCLFVVDTNMLLHRGIIYLSLYWDSSVSIATGYGLNCRGLIPGGGKIFFFSTVFRPAMGPGCSFPRGKAPEA
jgi:hypothetical protein